MQKNCLPSDGDAGNISCIFNFSYSDSRKNTQLNEQVEQLQKDNTQLKQQVEQLQKDNTQQKKQVEQLQKDNTQQKQQVEQLQKLQKDVHKEQETLKTHMGYCSANLNRLGISTDPDSLETYNEYSCGNHCNW